VSIGSLGALVLVPPVNCLATACLGVALGRRRFGRPLTIIGLAGLVLFSLPIVSGSLIFALETGLNTTPPAADPPQAIVILSGDQTEIRTGLTSAFRVGLLTLEREQAGAALARRTHLPVLVTGGAIHPWSPPLADIMDASMESDFGVKVTWSERASLDTWGNASLSAAILHKAGIHSVYLVTQAWHMKRALLAFRHAGLAVTPAPVAVEAQPVLRASAFVPLAHSWLESYYAMHELIGWAWYAVRP
jgi:uncharacterized SAM-binding protein YcdF (DUF218 family)